MQLTTDYWRDYWRDRRDPENHQDASGIELWASEFRTLVAQRPYRSVLEIACGTGEFYKRLGFDRSDYRGVDFSPGMLETFRHRYPGVRVQQADARTFVPEAPVDLIVSSGLLQYLTPADVGRHLHNVAGKLEPGGRILHLSVPWRALRWQYYLGAVDGGADSMTGKLKSSLGGLAEMAGLRPAIGNWHSMFQFRRMAASAGLDARFFGSIAQPFRFHVCFTANVG